MVMKSLCNEWLASFASRDYENVTIGTPAEESGEVFLKAACVFVHRKCWVLFLFIGSVGFWFCS